MADIRQDDKGQLYLVDSTGGGKPITKEQADTILSDPGMLESFGESAYASANELMMGLGDMIPGTTRNEGYEDKLQGYRDTQAAHGDVNPLSTLAGQATPAIAAGVATGGGVLPVAATEALIGAGYDDENRLRGAALGGALGAGAAALPGAAQAVRKRVTRRRPKPGILGADDAPATPQENRYNKGMLSDEEMAEVGLDSTNADRMQLNATDDLENMAAIQKRTEEDLIARDPIMGRQLNQKKANNEIAVTRWLNEQLGMENKAFTPAHIGDGFEMYGKQYDELYEAAGSLDVEPMKVEFAQVAEDSIYPKKMEKIAQEVEDRASKTGGVLTGEDAGIMRAKLNKSINSTNDVTLRQDIQNMHEVINNAVERALEGTPYESQIDRINRGYRILKTLQRPGVIKSTGSGINYPSFRNNWQSRKGVSGYKAAREDKVNRLVNTLAMIDTKLSPDSGTAQGLLKARAMGKVTPMLENVAKGAALTGGAGLLYSMD